MPTRHVTNFNLIEGSNIGVVNREVIRILELEWLHCASTASGTKSEKIVQIQAMVHYENY